MNKIVIVGAGGHANSCIDVIEEEGRYKIIGLIDNNIHSNTTITKYKIIGNDSDLNIIRKKCNYAIVAIGQIKSPNLRVRIYERLKKENFILPFIKSPKSHVSKYSKIGEGTIIMHGVIINISSLIGNNCIINTSSVIEHNAIIGSHCHISTKAIINEDVTIGDKTFIGSGSVIFQGVKIGTNCVISAGSIIKKNLSDNTLFKNES